MWKDVLLMRPAFVERPEVPTPTRRRGPILVGAAAGLACGLLARAWFRALADHPVFSVGGTLFIALAFGGVGALAGLAFALRREGRFGRSWQVRLAGLAPVLLLGPGLPLFTPSVALAFALPRRRRWLRRALEGVAGVALLALALVLLGRGPLSLLLWLLLSWALFLSARLAFEPLARREERYLLTT